MQKLEEHISNSKRGILNLKANWDNEGTQGYAQETWDRAMNFLRGFLKQMWTQYLFIPFPNILPAPEGSIDLNWDAENVNLLINIPQNAVEPVSFYSEYHHKKEIEGSIELALVDSVLIP